MKSSGWITFSTPGPGSDWVRQAFLEGKGESMSEKRYVVPAGMLRVAMEHINMAMPESVSQSYHVKQGLEAAVRWLAENPVLPTVDQVRSISAESIGVGYARDVQVCAEWQRRMFLAPAPEIPEEIKDLDKKTISSWPSRLP